MTSLDWDCAIVKTFPGSPMMQAQFWPGGARGSQSLAELSQEPASHL